MNMVFRQREYQRGEQVGIVDLLQLFGPQQVPVAPERWYVLRVFPGRERQVMKTFRRRNISAWMPLNTNTQNVTRHLRGYDITVEQQVTSPMITGAVLLPDFEVRSERFAAVDGVIGIYTVGPCVPVLGPGEVAQLRNCEAIANTPKSKRARKFETGELVRVTSGPFAYFGARVERLDSPGRLTVGVKLFGRINLVDIDESDIEKI